MLIALMLQQRGEGPNITIDWGLMVALVFTAAALVLGAAVKVADWWKRWKDGRKRW